ncbi:MAG: succinate--CoA ligase, partial [Betaproteobacteria bacterium]|nr:succinate--CoA ligase [Betaproteobacteria bacterium]
IETLKPELPIFFSVHGTGDEEAIRMLKDRLGVTPLPTMEDACKAAVEAAA